jgi:heme-degrading monooxygenase HmoA
MERSHNRIQLEVVANMYLIAWEFLVAPGQADAFEVAYGPDGVWASLFQRSSRYRGTQLLKDTSSPGRYWTLDLWEDEEAFETFHREHSKEYAEIDRQCEALTESEKRLGTFVVVDD